METSVKVSMLRGIAQLRHATSPKAERLTGLTPWRDIEHYIPCQGSHLDLAP
ncbi:unnamed protein product, partial [marine sediment metagenome]